MTLSECVFRRPAYVQCRAHQISETIGNHKLEITTLANLASLEVSLEFNVLRTLQRREKFGLYGKTHVPFKSVAEQCEFDSVLLPISNNPQKNR